MQSIRTYLISAAACSLLVPFAACGGGDDGGGGDDDVPTGMHYGYVVSKAYVPSTNAEANDWSLDIAAAKSGTPDGLNDNSLGSAFVFLASQGLSVQDTITTAITHGSILLLVDYQTSDFATAGAAGLAIKIGATATPTPCTDANDMTCGHHLNGSGMFTVAAGTPNNAALTGKIQGGTFNGGPGDLTLQIAVGAPTPITLNLHNARAKVVSASATGLTMTLDGALTITDLNSSIIPAIHQTLVGLMDMNCPAPRNPDASCSCTGSTKLIVDLLDKNPHDCKLTVDEVQNSNVLKAFLMPDVCSTATCAAPDALSIGLKLDAVKATF